MREVGKSDDDGHAEKLRVRGKKREGAERIGHVPSGSSAALGRKRLGQYEETVEGVGEAESGGDPDLVAEIPEMMRPRKSQRREGARAMTT